MKPCLKELEFKDYYKSTFDEALKRFGLSSIVEERDSIIRIWWIDFYERTKPTFASTNLLEISISNRMMHASLFVMDWYNQLKNPDSLIFDIKEAKKCVVVGKLSTSNAYNEFVKIAADRIHTLPVYSKIDDDTGDDFKYLQYLYGLTTYTVDFSRRSRLSESKHKREQVYWKLLLFLKHNYGIKVIKGM